MVDFEQRFLREREARKQAEAQLENVAREIHLKNLQLGREIDKKNLLVTVSSYSQNQLRLVELLPVIMAEITNITQCPLAFFDYFPLNREEPVYRSNGFVQSQSHRKKFAHIEHCPIRLENLAGRLDKKIQRPIFIPSSEFSSLVDDRLSEDLIFQQVVLFTVFVDAHTSAILYFFDQDTFRPEDEICELIQSATTQLGLLVEHRYHQEKIAKNYQKLKKTHSELQFTQRQLVQSEKMASIGQLSAGIAHEINNPVGFIKSNINTLNSYLDVYYQSIDLIKKIVEEGGAGDNPASKLKALWDKEDIDYILSDSQLLVEESQQGIERIVEIVAGMKQFTRQSEKKRETFDIGDCLDESLKLVNNEIKYKAELIKNYSPNCLVFGRRNELIQVFINLLVNATQAFKKQGTISLSTEIVDDKVVVKVMDDGCGIEPEKLSQIFNPFFTTKPVGTGTGLGLSISYGIIDNHEGKISVESELNIGTTFTIELPLADENAE